MNPLVLIPIRRSRFPINAGCGGRCQISEHPRRDGHIVLLDPPKAGQEDRHEGRTDDDFIFFKNIGNH